MSLPLESFQDFYDLAIQTATSDSNGVLTDTTEGSILDTIAGLVSTLVVEMQNVLVDRFNNCFIELANGPEVTLGPDDLQTLAVDHFGSNFARPGATQAIDTATFSRANNSAGSITIPIGSIIQTQPDANGTSYQYSTDVQVILTNNSSPSDTSVSVGIKAVIAGSASNAGAGQINVIITPLLDKSITVSNAGNETGEDAQDDSTYRETIRNLIQALAGATTQAIQAQALTVSGVATATPVESAINAIQWNIATSEPIGSYFRIAQPVLYIADDTGMASPALLQAVQTALTSVRACGILIQVASATAFSVNWTASITLNPSGPNYSTLVNDDTQIVQSMTDYINNLPVGTGFVRSNANAAIMAIWGPSGTNDLTAFTTSVPSGDVSATATQKMVAGTVGTD